MGCGYSKQTPEGGRVPITLHSFHQVRLQEMRMCKAAGILHVDATPSKKLSLFESTEEDLIQSSENENVEATAKVVGVKADARLLVEKSFKVVPIAYFDNETYEENEMQMNRPKANLQDKDGDVKRQMEMIEDDDDAERKSNVTYSNKGESAKETLDGTAKISAINNTRQQRQELKGGSVNKLPEAITKEEAGNDDGDSDRHTSQIDGPPSFRVYCLQPSQEIEQEEEEGHQKRSSGDSFGSILSVSSWSSHQFAETNEKKQRRKKKFAKAVMGGSVTMRNLLICKAGNCSHSHRIDHDRGRNMAARVAH